MKHLVIAILLSVTANANAFTGCENADGSFTVGIYETSPVKVLIMDKNVSVAPLAYLCSKSTLTNNGDKLAAYGCTGGGMGDDKKIAVYVNESKGIANFQDLDNEDNDKSNLACEIIK